MAAVSSLASQGPTDPWDQPVASGSSRRRAPPTPAATVPDDWENDDDEGPQNEVDNQRIWDDANNKAPNPMPSLVLSPSSTSTRTILSPPPGAFEPKMRILKRPSAPSSKPSTPPPSSASAESLKEREARYQAARERIFGEESPREGSPSPKSPRERKERKSSGSPHHTPSVSVVRNPRGPSHNSAESTNGTVARGFGGRRAGPPLTSQDAVGGSYESPT
ncbi:hypothetical protein BDZ94DRAFT_1249804 [Collybia nuda]|uniref:SUZ domain-containing protein n=1 Tax=Collybia nuda TaxID=64659 RepID=A0A9P5YE36_9AGAR|nr:hypothetical protein BDZ94DRAFT_1249804 [Collybia nuda]